MSNINMFRTGQYPDSPTSYGQFSIKILLRVVHKHGGELSIIHKMFVDNCPKDICGQLSKRYLWTTVHKMFVNNFP